MMIDKVKAAGRTPVIPHIPYSSDLGDAGVPSYADIPSYNAVIDQLVQSNQLTTGPDLYAFFMAHPDQLMADGLHPSNEQGQASINQLWATAMQPLYP